MDDIFLNAELLLCCCACCETYDEPNNNNHNNYSNREKLLRSETLVTTGTLVNSVTSLTNEERLQKNQCIKRE